jgi:hypothetical protein
MPQAEPSTDDNFWTEEQFAQLSEETFSEWLSENDTVAFADL